MKKNDEKFQVNKIPKDNEYRTCLPVRFYFCQFIKKISTNILRRMQILLKKKKIKDTINEELELDKSDDELNKFNFCRFINVCVIYY